MDIYCESGGLGSFCSEMASFHTSVMGSSELASIRSEPSISAKSSCRRSEHYEEASLGSAFA